MQSIHVEVKAREASDSTKVNVGKSFQQQGSTSSSHSTASALVVGNEWIQYVHCKGKHFSASCNVVKTVSE